MNRVLYITLIIVLIIILIAIIWMIFMGCTDEEAMMNESPDRPLQPHQPPQSPQLPIIIAAPQPPSQPQNHIPSQPQNHIPSQPQNQIPRHTQNPTGVDFKMTTGRPMPGMTCTRINRELCDPNNSKDNTYLCSSKDVGMRWSATGPIDNMTCMKVEDKEDPHSWNDGYLCLPNNSPLSMNMYDQQPPPRAPNRKCVRWIDPPEQDDYAIERYLCMGSEYSDL